VRKYQPGNARFVVTFRPEGEFEAEAFAEVCAKKCAKPGPPAFRDREDDGLTPRKFTCTATEITARPSWSWSPQSRSRDGFVCRRNGYPPTLLVNRSLLRLRSSQRSRCYFNCHAGSLFIEPAALPRGSQNARVCCIRTQNEVFVQAQSGAYWLRLIVGSAGGMSRMVRWPR